MICCPECRFCKEVWQSFSPYTDQICAQNWVHWLEEAVHDVLIPLPLWMTLSRRRPHSYLFCSVLSLCLPPATSRHKAPDALWLSHPSWSPVHIPKPSSSVDTPTFHYLIRTLSVYTVTNSSCCQYCALALTQKQNPFSVSFCFLNVALEVQRFWWCWCACIILARGHEYPQQILLFVFRAKYVIMQIFSHLLILSFFPWPDFLSALSSSFQVIGKSRSISRERHTIYCLRYFTIK